MAAVLTDVLSGGQVHVRSAGSAPVAELNPAVVAVIAELGMDMSEAFPKPLTDDVLRAAEVVITMGCGEVRDIREHIRLKIETMLEQRGSESARIDR